MNQIALRVVTEPATRSAAEAIEEWLGRAERCRMEAQLAAWHARIIEERLAPLIDLHRAAAAHDAQLAQLVARFDALTAHDADEAWLSAKEAATRLGLMQADGSAPRDSFYKLAKQRGWQKIAGKVSVPESDLLAFMRGRT